MKKLNTLFLLISIIICSCDSKKAENGIVVQTKEQPAEIKPTATCIWKEVSVKSTPSEKGKYLTSVFLGERFSMLGDTASENLNGKRTHYSNIQLTDGTEGWIRTDLIATGAIGAAFVDEATIYKRPDLMTSTNKQFSSMDFVAVKTKAASGWVEVVGKRPGDTWFTTGWVKEENLTYEEVDVAFSIFYNRAIEIADEKKRTSELSSLLKKSELNGSVFYARVDNLIKAEVEGPLNQMEQPALADSAAGN